MLSGSRWFALKGTWTEADLAEINMVWHRLDGKTRSLKKRFKLDVLPIMVSLVNVGWADSSKGLALLKKRFIVSTLTNGNARLMVDMVRLPLFSLCRNSIARKPGETR